MPELPEPELLSMNDAVRLLGVRRQTLDKKLKARGLEVVRRVERGRVCVYLQRSWLADLSKPVQPAQQPVQPADAARAVEAAKAALPAMRELEALRAKLEAITTEKHELAGRLAGAELVERATSRRCDKLEATLDEERKRCELLQRDLGRQEAAIMLLREQRAVKRSWMARLLGRG
jgi:predicted RNase H-like nuclease (RuvC/YqgF family)